MSLYFDWQIASTSGLSGSKGNKAAGGGTIYLKKPSSNENRTLQFAGATFGVGPLPFSIDFSLARFPSFATYLLKGPTRILQADIPLSDLTGPCVIYSGALVGLGGGTGTIFCFGVAEVSGWTAIAAIAAGPLGVSGLIAGAAATAHAFGASVGAAGGLDVGISVLIGKMFI